MSENRSATPTAAGTGAFSAADLRRRMAEREAAKAAEELRHIKEQEEKQKAVMEEFHKPPERTPEQLMQLVMQLVNRAAERGQSEVQVYRFPNALCSDQRTADQQLGPRLGHDLGGPPSRRLRILARPLAAARLPPEGSGARISGRNARRHRLFLTW